MPDLLLAVPSRGRPHNISRLIDHMNSTCTMETTLVIGLDEDDYALPEYMQHIGRRPGTEVEVRAGLRQVVGWMNELAMPRLGDYPFVGHIGDDNVPLTHGWDARIIAALRETPFAYANDLYGRPAPPHPNALCCHVFMRSEIGKALGYIGIPHVRHMYVDTAWMQWGLATGISYLEDVIIDHVHYTTGRAGWDQSYGASTGLMPADSEAYNDYCRSGALSADIQKIREATEGVKYLDPSLEEIEAINRGLNIPSGPVRPDWQPGQPLS